MTKYPTTPISTPKTIDIIVIGIIDFLSSLAARIMTGIANNKFNNPPLSHQGNPHFIEKIINGAIK